MSKIVCNIEETVCTPSSNPTVTGSYVRCNIEDSSCVPTTPTEGGAAAPTYILSGPSSVNENESGIFTVATTGVDEGLLIPYTLTGVQSADVVGGSLTGTFEIDANGAGSVTIEMVEDFVAEGETMVMTIGSALNPLDFINVSIIDPTYSLSSAGTMVEGNSLSFNLTTTGISDGETRNWDITGSGHSLSTTSGTLTINSNAASVSISSVYDAVYQGTSNFTFRVFGSDGVTVVDTINFTVTDAASTYSQSSATAFDEGTSLAVTVSTTNVQDSTTLYWTVNHGTTATADFTAESGSFTVTSNSGSFNVEAVADTTTEGAETFTIELRTGSITGPIVDTSSTITINDTSLSQPSVSFSNQKYYKASTRTGVVSPDLILAGTNKNPFANNNNMPSLDDDFSMSFWLQVPSAGSTFDPVIAFAGSDTRAHFKLFHLGGYLTASFTSNGNAVDYRCAHTTYNTWQHVVITKKAVIPRNPNYNNTDYFLQIYIDGVPQNPSVSYWDNVPGFATTSWDNLTISEVLISGPARSYTINGSYASNKSGRQWKVDELAFYSKELTQADVNTIYNSGTTKDLMSLSSSFNLSKYFRLGDHANDVVTTGSIECYDEVLDTVYFEDNGGTIENHAASDAPYVPASGSWANDYYVAVSSSANSGYIETDSMSMNCQTGWSLSFWLKVPNLNTSYTNALYVTLNDGTRDQYNRLDPIQWQYRGSNNNYISFGGALVQFYNSPVLDDNNWHHVALTWSNTGITSTTTILGSTLNSNLKLYLDGNIRTYQTYQGTGITGATSFDKLRVGDNVLNQTEPSFNLSELAFWYGSTLSGQQVSDIYNLGTPNDITSISNMPSPTRYYLFEDNTDLSLDSITNTTKGTNSGLTRTSYP